DAVVHGRATDPVEVVADERVVVAATRDGAGAVIAGGRPRAELVVHDAPPVGVALQVDRRRIRRCVGRDGDVQARHDDPVGVLLVAVTHAVDAAVAAGRTLVLHLLV